MRSRRDKHRIWQILCTTLLFSCSVVSHAECRVPQAPQFPSVENASLESLELAHHNMQAFISRTEDYLDCLSPEERKLRMDDVLAKMKQASADYSALRSAYRKQQAMQLYLEGES